MTKRAIIADDDLEMRDSLLKVLGMAFREEEVEVIIDEVSNGRELVERARKINYDIILTDYDMPGGDGLTAIREIRRTNKSVIIYMLSGRDIREEALKAGATEFFYKGPNFGETVRDIRDAIRNPPKN